MAKLPGPENIPLQVPQATRPAVSYEGGIAERAGIGLGEAEMAAGQTQVRTGQEVQDIHDRIARAAAEQTFITKKLDIDQQFATDTDYQTAPQRYRAALQGAVGEAGQGIIGAAQRSDFSNWSAKLTEYGTNRFLQDSVARWRNQGQGDTNDAINTAIDSALRAPDEPTRAALFASVHDRIDAAVQAGFYTPTHAAAVRKATAQNYAFERGKMLADTDPAAAVRALAPSGQDEGGNPIFSPAGDWRDHLDPGKRMDIVRSAQQHSEALSRAAEVDAMRQERLRDKADKDAADKVANEVVTQLGNDPSKVDPVALANDTRIPASQWHVKEALLNMTRAAIQRDDGKDTKTYGPGFWSAYQSIHAPDGTEGKITDPAALYSRAGPDGDLTVAGVDKLTSEIQARRTPEGEAESEMKKQFLKNARGQITGTNEGLHLQDPNGDELYLKFMAQALPAYDAGRRAGKSASQLLNPDSPDYIGKSIATFKRSPAQWVSDMMKDNVPPSVNPDVDADTVDLTTKDGITAAYKAGKITYDAASSALIQGGFAAPAVPPKVGDERDGYRFKGGNPADQASWQKLPAAPISR